MINVRSLRFRLAAWYFASVAAIFVLAALGFWAAVRTSLTVALDEGLRYRLEGLREFLLTSADDPAEELAEISRLGDLFQVFDADGRLIARSAGLDRHRVDLQPPAALPSGILYQTGGPPGFELRMAWQTVSIRGRALTLCAADPQRKYGVVLKTFTSVLLFSLPFILGAAVVCGVLFGARALAPVARITADARAIGETSLSARLAVPQSGDEVQQLSETLNGMLNRIESSFNRTRQFTADASHELRAPMTLIHTAAQFSLRRDRSREELADNMRKILRESGRTTALVNDLLLLARGDARQEPAQFETIDAAALVRDLAEQAAPVAESKEIRLDVEVPDVSLLVQADDSKLRRLLLILTDNAIKYTARGGSVRLRAAVSAHEIAISVADTGVGIAREDLPHVFERFWRADKARTREAGGAGLGLAIAKQIAAQHNARLTVESELGKGSVFTIFFQTASQHR